MLDEKSSNTMSVMVLCTALDEVTTQDLATKMLAEELATYTTLTPGTTSLYYWEGKPEQEYEVQMILKTTVPHQQALLEYLKSYHPYQTPELLALPITHGSTDYLSWLNVFSRRSYYFAALPFPPDYSTRRDVYNLFLWIKSLLSTFSKTSATLI